MDPVTMIFYAAVCGTLAAVAPSLGTRPARFAAGAAIGAIAATVLGFLRAKIGI